VGLLIALFVFFAVQGIMLDVSILVVAVFVTAGFILQARQKRRERRGEVAQALGEVEAILRGRPE